MPYLILVHVWKLKRKKDSKNHSNSIITQRPRGWPGGHVDFMWDAIEF